MPGGFEVGSAFVSIGADFGKLSSGLNQASNEVQSRAKGMGNIFSNAFSFALGGAVTAALGAVTHQITNLVGVGVGGAADLQQAIANISTIKPEINTSSVFASLNEMQTRVPQTAAQLADSLYNVFSSIDVSQADALKLTEQFAKGAVGAGTSAETFGTAAIGVMNAYGLAVGDAAHISDVFFNTVNAGVVSGSELAGSLGPVTQAAKSAGVSLDQLGGLIAGVTKEGGNASENINNLNNFLAKITTKPAQKAMQDLGISTVDATGAFRAVPDVLTDLKDRLADMTEAQRANALQAIFPDVQARIGAQTLISQLDFVKGAIETNISASGSAMSAYEKMSATFQSQGALAKNALATLAMTVGNAVLPALTNFISTALIPGTKWLTNFASILLSSEHPLATLVSIIDSAIPGFAGFAETLGTGFGIARDAVLTFIQAIQGDWVNSSGILPFHAAVGELGLFISGTLVPAFQSLVGWVQENSTLLGQIAIAAGVAVAAFAGISTIVSVVGTVTAAFAGMSAAVTTAGGVIGAIVAVLGGPVTIAIGAVALAVGALALAWQTDFLGIQTNLTAWWTGTGQPIFNELATWLGTNIPVAIGVLVGFWNGTLLPAIQTVGSFLLANVVPAFVTLGQWLGTNIPVAITALAGFWTGTLQPALSAVWSFITGSVIPTLTTLATGAMVAVGTAATTLAGFWTNTLQPALSAVWAFIQNSVIPLLASLANVYFAALNLAVTAAAGLWQNVLQPALSAVWTFISSNLQPVIQTLADFFTGTLSPAVSSAGSTLSTVLGPAITAVTGFFGGLYTAIGGISGAIGTVIGWLDKMASKLNNLKLPAWLTPGSPTPFEWGLRGIAEGADLVSKALSGVGDTFKSGNIKEMLATLSSLKGASEGLGALVTFKAPSSGSITAFVSSAVALVSGLGTAAQTFKEKWLEQAQKFFDAAGKGMSILSAAVDGLNKLRTFKAPSIASINAFTDTVILLVQSLGTAAQIFKADWIEHANLFLESAGRGLSIITMGIDGLVKMRDFKAPSIAAVNAFTDTVVLLIQSLGTAATVFKDKWLLHAQVFTDTAGKGLAIVGSGVDGLTKLADFKAPSIGAMNAFTDTVTLLVQSLGTVAQVFKDKWLTQANSFTDTALKGLGVIGSGIEGLGKLTTFRAPALSAITAFSDTIRLVVRAMGDLAASFTEEDLTQTALSSEAIGKIVAPFKAVTDAFASIKNYKGIAAAAFRLLAQDIDGVIQTMVIIAQHVSAEGITAAAAFGDAVGKVMDGLKSTLDTFKDLNAYKGVAPKAVKLLISDLYGVIGTLQGFFASAGGAMQDADAWQTTMEAVAGAVQSGVDALNSIAAVKDVGEGIKAFAEGLTQLGTVFTTAFVSLMDTVLIPWQNDTRTFFSGAGFGFIGAVSDGIMSAAGGLAQMAGSAGGAAGQSLVSSLSSAAAGVNTVVGNINSALGSIERNITITITTVHREVTAP